MKTEKQNISKQRIYRQTYTYLGGRKWPTSGYLPVYFYVVYRVERDINNLDNFINISEKHIIFLFYFSSNLNLRPKFWCGARACIVVYSERWTECALSRTLPTWTATTMSLPAVPPPVWGRGGVTKGIAYPIARPSPVPFRPIAKSARKLAHPRKRKKKIYI